MARNIISALIFHLVTRQRKSTKLFRWMWEYLVVYWETTVWPLIFNYQKNFHPKAWVSHGWTGLRDVERLRINRDVYGVYRGDGRGRQQRLLLLWFRFDCDLAMIDWELTNVYGICEGDDGRQQWRKWYCATMAVDIVLVLRLWWLQYKLLIVILRCNGRRYVEEEQNVGGNCNFIPNKGRRVLQKG